MDIQQVFFPNQRNDEKIFVVARQHFILFLKNVFLIILLTVLPFIFILILSQTLFSLNSTNNIILRDVFYLAVCIYFLTELNFFMANWISYYYNILIVTDERLVEITQDGLFNRNINELSFERVQDISCHTHGFLSTLFNAGDIEVQTGASQPNFHLKNIPLAQDVTGIIGELVVQSKEGVPHRDRIPNLPVIGIIESKYIYRDGKIPPIMNLEMNLKDAESEANKTFNSPRTLRGKIDHWWWRHKSHSTISLGSVDQNDPGKINLEDY
jgi:hypothetical protein